MDNSKIYENLLIKQCFNRLKAIRNSWAYSNGEVFGLDTIIDIGGVDYRFYNFIMEKSESVIIETIPCIITALLKSYGLKANYYQITRNDAHIYSVSEKENWPDYVEQNNKKGIFAFNCTDGNHSGILYIFKEFGIGNHLPKSLIKKFLTENELKGYCYISLVEKEAYKEIVNHNDNPEDPSRGTGIYSLKQFFDAFFDKDEYSTFKKHIDKFSELVRDYYGFEIVRTLRPNTMHNFRKAVKESLYSIDINDIDKEGKISEVQRQIIRNAVFTEHNIELMTGTSLFAQSYMTAEWLYTSLSSAGNIDMTSIVMGYYKSIEQLLFSYISLHTKERDVIKRDIFIGKKKPNANAKGYAELTDALINDGERIKDLTMSSLTGFFGFYHENTKNYEDKNKDLLANGINDDTYHYIIDVLIKVPETRNELFHKRNLTEWREVVEARDIAQRVIFLVLGAYKIDKDDKITLGLIDADHCDDFQKLCEYINSRLHENNSITERTIFYLDANAEPFDCWIAIDDSYIEYDEYGEPNYSGLYFKRPDNDKYILRIKKDNLPLEIWEGVWDFSGEVPNMLGQSGPQKKIFAEGNFLL